MQENNFKFVYGEKNSIRIFLNGTQIPSVLSIDKLQIPTMNERGIVTLTIHIDKIEIE